MKRISLLKKQEAAARSSGDIVGANNILAEIDRLKAGVKTASDIIKDDFQAGFEDAFTGILDGTKSVSDAFEDMGRSILQSVNKMIAQNLSEQIMGSLFKPTATSNSGGGLLGGFFSNLFGQGFASGGSFSVGGSGGIDSQPVSFMATPGEKVTVTKPDQKAGGGMTVVNNFSISAPRGTIDRDSQQQTAAAVGQSIQVAMRRNT